MSFSTTKNVILAADGVSSTDCRQLIQAVEGEIFALKIHDMYDRAGGVGIEVAKEGSINAASQPKVLIDFQINHTPLVVGLRVKALRLNGADMITVQASVGLEALQSAVKAANGKTHIYAATALQSITTPIAKRIYGNTPDQLDIILASIAREAGCHGLYCTAQTACTLRKRSEYDHMKVIAHDIVLASDNDPDPKRINTPLAALNAGADYIVIGREITNNIRPAEALEKLANQIQQE